MYKDTQKQKEANRLASLKRRQKVKGMTVEGMTPTGMTDKGVTLLKRPNGEDYDPGEMLGNRHRYMVLSDKQVLDRQTLPHVVDIPTIVKEDRIYPAIVYALTENRAKLRKICQSLKEHNVLKEVQYGTGGPTFDVVAEMLAVVG